MKIQPLLLVVTAFSGLAASVNPALAQTWTPTGAPIANWSCVAASADGKQLAATVNGGSIYTSTDSGATWSATSAPITNWSCIASSADGRKLVAGSAGGRYGGLIYVSSNSGATWLTPGGPSVGWTSVASSADGTRLAANCLDSEGFLASTDSGFIWTEIGPEVIPIGEAYYLVASTADGSRVATISSWDGLYGTIEVSTDLALPFHEVGLSGVAGSYYVSALACSADGSQFAVACTSYSPPAPICAGWLLTVSNSGSALTSTPTPVGTWTSIASSADGTRLAAVATGNAIYTSANSGTTWTVTPVPEGNWVSIASSADGTKLVAAVAGGGIYAWQTTPRPVLTTVPSGTNVFLSWLIPSIQFGLQQSSDLTTPNWVDLPVQPTLNLTNLQNQVLLPAAPAANSFYRLKASSN
jgi:hypothetical protein